MHRHFLSLVLSVASPGAAMPDTCANGVVSVHASDQALQSRLCAYADTALDQVASCDLPMPDPVTITLSDSLPPGCVGIFHCGEQRIELLTPEALAERRSTTGLFATVSTDRFLASLVTHELAHAIYEKAPCPFESCVVTSEYFAYTQQIASLSDEDRALIESAWPDGTVARSGDINAVVLYMAPNRFAQSAWQHLLAQPDRCTYWRAILDGEVIFDRERP